MYMTDSFPIIKQVEIDRFTSKICDVSGKLPRFKRQIWQLAKVGVPRDQGQFVLLSDRRDPNVVFRNWTTPLAEEILELTVVLCSAGITNQDTTRGCKLIDCLNIRLDSTRLDLRAP